MNELEFIKPDWKTSPRVRALVTTRAGGFSKTPYDSFNLAQHVGDCSETVTRNRELLLNSLQGNPKLQWLQQVHGNETEIVTEAGQELEADGLITRATGVACCVMTADCLPIFFAADSGKEVALVHGGWRGLAAGIIENTVARLQTPAAELSVWLGPAIASCHFEVGEDVRMAFLSQASCEDSEQKFRNCFQALAADGKYLADIYGLARILLRRAGIKNTSGGDCCSYCDSARYYSYRRDGTTGRMLSLIYLQD